VLQKHHLTDVCCVVTRYFGGILLGGGGLVRAYSGSTALAVEHAHIMVMRPCRAVTLTMDYALYGKVSYVLPQYGVLQQHADFGDVVSLTLLVEEAGLDALHGDLVELTGDQILWSQGEVQYADFSSVAGTSPDRLP
jgi:putative IMPACT (imprinted ancient) family translation regulator